MRRSASRYGMPAADAMTSAKGIVLADLVGHESHGVSNNLAGFYLPDLENGVINPNPNMRITRESPSTATWLALRTMAVDVKLIVGWSAASKKSASNRRSRSMGKARTLSTSTEPEMTSASASKRHSNASKALRNVLTQWWMIRKAIVEW